MRDTFGEDPFDGSLFVFFNKRRDRTKLLLFKLLAYDGQGFWLRHKRLSAGRFRFWPAGTHAAISALEAHELAVLLRGGDPHGTRAAGVWRVVPAGA